VDVSALRRSFDAVAEAYAAQFAEELSRKPFDRGWLERFAAAWRGPGPVLEVGCGPGHVGRFVAALGPPVVGLDLSPRSLAAGARRFPGAPLVAGDMQALPVRPDACGGVLGFYALIYFDPEATFSILSELRRAAAPGAPLLLAVHAGEGHERFSEFQGTPIDVTLRYHRPEDLAALCRRAGFAVTALETRPPYAFEHPTTRLYVAGHAAGGV